MSPDDKVILEKNGWDIDCESPLEISSKDGSTASGEAVEIVIDYLKLLHKKEGDHVGEKCPICKYSIRKNVIRDIKGCTNNGCLNYYFNKVKK